MTAVAARFDLVIRNTTLVTPAGRRDADIGIAGGRFSAIVGARSLDVRAAEEIDATGLHALPGVIDGHVHFRSPGLEHEEDWLTGTRAAVFGGVTTVLDMPNTVPPTDTVERAREKLALATASAYCDFGLFGLLGPSVDAAIELAQSELVVGLKAFLGPTTGHLSAPDDDGLRRGLEATAGLGMRVAFHAEDGTIIEAAEEALRKAHRVDASAHRDARPAEAEVQAIDRVGRLLRTTSAAGHVLHLTSADGLGAVGGWQKLGADLTCEATPHHLLLDGDAYERARGLAKVNPPIRGDPHRSRLLAALSDDRVNCLASDHAPHLDADKRRDSIWDVPAGIPGVEILLPLMLTEAAAGRLSLERLAYLTSAGPAQVWGLWPPKGSVLIGSDADLVLVDLDRESVVRAADLHGKNNATPFEGWPTRGAPVATIVRGKVVMRDGELLAEPGWGRALNPYERSQKER